MRLFEPWEQLEEKEDRLRQEVNELPESQRKAYYSKQSTTLKDPDTYAALNWLFLGGFHHCYLEKYPLFVIELILLIIGITGLLLGYLNAIWIILLLVFFELPQLFFAQKIVRQHNYELSCHIVEEVRRGSP